MDPRGAVTHHLGCIKNSSSRPIELLSHILWQPRYCTSGDDCATHFWLKSQTFTVVTLPQLPFDITAMTSIACV